MGIVNRELKILVSRCDICNNLITGAPDDLESQLEMSNDTDGNPRIDNLITLNWKL